MTIVALEHVQLAMPPNGEGLAREFYEGVLGIPEVPKPPELRARGGCWFEKGDMKVHLGVEVDFRAARKAHPGFLVQDLSALVSRLEKAGCHIETAHLPEVRRVFTFDPFGNRIELIERTTSPP